MRGSRDTLRRLTGFGLVGIGSFLVDLAVLLVLSRGLGMPPLLARLPAVAVAMVFGWYCNRVYTFRPDHPPNLGEFLRYAMASGAAVAFNYAVFAALVLAWPRLPLAAAAFTGAALAAVLSYAGYRHFAFRPRK